MMIATVGLPLISIVTPRRRLQNCLVSLVFQTITIIADVGLPLVSRRSLQRGDRRRPPFIFTLGMQVGLRMELGLGPGNFVLDWDLAPPRKKGGGAAPKFSAHFYFGQTAGCIKMPLGMDVGLIPSDFVLDGDPVPLPNKVAEPSPQIFGPCLLWPNGWVDQDATLHEGRP